MLYITILVSSEMQYLSKNLPLDKHQGHVYLQKQLYKILSLNFTLT